MARTATPPHLTQPQTGRPSPGVLLRWGGVVLALHLVLLLNMAGTLDWQIKSPPVQASGPLQTRMILPAETGANAPQGKQLAKPEPSRTRIAIEHVARRPAPAALQALAPPPALDPWPTAATPPDVLQGPTEQAPDPEPGTAAIPLPGSPLDPAPVAPAPMDPSPAAPQPPSVVRAELSPDVDKLPAAAGLPTPPTVMVPPAETAAFAEPAPMASPAPSAATADPAQATPAAPAITSPAPSEAATAAAPVAPLARATLDLPSLPLAAIPPSTLLSYRLQGQEKGLNYSATGELRWQRNDSAYAMALTVKALLLGSRHWRSQGQVTPEGLAPIKFSDSWRSERVAHFDRPNQRIVFSNNAPSVPLQNGAQDQVSLYVQLAAAMAQQSTPLPVGTRLQIQTATVRDALPWLLTLEKTETLQLDGRAVPSTLWVCQPRNRFDARVEFWVAAEHDWLPARIRITQTTGSFIDLQLTGRTTLPDLPSSQTPG